MIHIYSTNFNLEIPKLLQIIIYILIKDFEMLGKEENVIF
jgi:hypothetical protein